MLSNQKIDLQSFFFRVNITYHEAKIFTYFFRFMQANVSPTFASIFLCRSEEPFCGFFPQGIHFLHSYRMPDILTLFHVWLPDMPRHYLHVIPDFRALAQVRTAFTDCATALVFPVAGTVRCLVCQYLSIRAYIADKVFIIHILGFKDNYPAENIKKMAIKNV